MELVPNTDNVVYIDEYPELKKKVWLRRLAEQRAGVEVTRQLIVLPLFPQPDGIA